MSESERSCNMFSWSRVRTTEEIGDFVTRRLATLESVSLDF